MNYLSKARKVISLGRQEFRSSIIERIRPSKPRTLNLLVNDTCNSKCQMCLIWKNKLDREFSTTELREILSDDLFSNLMYVGVSGGEPTLRKDLPEIFQVICEKRPSLKGIGIITNGIIKDSVRENILECSSICNSYNIPFNVMLSIDGIGKIHDTVRGRPGNFDSSIALLKFFKDKTEIPVSFGCTITKSNVFHVDELLDFAIHEKIYGRFRIAEFIERLYNEQQKDYIRAFDELESYHLGLFFHRLETEFETNSTYQKTYRNIRKMIAENSPRLIGCPYQSDAVVVTSRGDLLYCSPKSPILGNLLSETASSLYYSKIKIRNDIKKNECQSCIHDYHEPLTLKEYLAQGITRRIKQFKYGLDHLLTQSQKIKAPIIQECKSIESYSSKNVLIIGWYGTETVGDKAILWSIIQDLRKRQKPPEKITLSSLFPFVSNWTLKEIQVQNVSIVETYSKEFTKAVNESDEIIVGGGPLMDLEVLDHILFAFINGSKRHIFKRVHGCGIGPLKDPRYTQAVSEIIRLADVITLRDSISVQRCVRDFVRRNVEMEGDPAIKFVDFYKNNRDCFEKKYFPFSAKSYVACFLREWGKDYSYGLDHDEYIGLKGRFEQNLVKIIGYLSNKDSLNINFLPMHSFHIGGDDRIFNRKISRALESGIQTTRSDFSSVISCSIAPASPAEILDNMMNAKINLCMRFHSILFAEFLEVPYIAIDYTRGGKIEAFLRDRNKLDRMLTIDEISSGQWKNKIDMFLEKIEM